MKQKFQIGEMVEAGMIVRATHPLLYLEMCYNTNGISVDEQLLRLNTSWSEQWQEAPVYYIRLNEPTRQMSYSDWLFKCEKLHYYKPEYFKEVYEVTIPIRTYLDIPEHLVATQILGEGGFDLDKVEKTDEQI